MFEWKVGWKCWTILTTKIYPTVPVETSLLRSSSTWGTVVSNFDIITPQIYGGIRIFANQTACQWGVPMIHSNIANIYVSNVVNSTKDQSEAEGDRDNNLHDDALALLHNEVQLYSIKYLNNPSNA